MISVYKDQLMVNIKLPCETYYLESITSSFTVCVSKAQWESVIKQESLSTSMYQYPTLNSSPLGISPQLYVTNSGSTEAYCNVLFCVVEDCSFPSSAALHSALFVSLLLVYEALEKYEVLSDKESKYITIKVMSTQLIHLYYKSLDISKSINSKPRGEN